jgi:trypsin-like peptidase
MTAKPVRWISTLLCLLAAAPAPASDLAEQGRAVYNKNRYAVVTVQVVVKATSGRGSGEFPQDVTGTVIDPSGLTVLALSACDPYEMNRRMVQDYKVESEITSVKILLDDGNELPSEIVLRDRDLDLAFVRPKSKPANPMAAVDLTKSGPAQVLDEVISLNRLNKAASRAYSASVEHIASVIQKPRTFYIPDSTMTATSSGSPAFLLDGRILGIFVMRAISGGGGGSGYRDNLTSIILPAEEILKGAKQAPEPKGEGEKKEEPKESTEKK